MRKSELINDPTRPKPAPIEYAGKWVAWNENRTEIIAHGETFAEVAAAIDALGKPLALMQRVRRPDEMMIG
jgi:hypothetical protein